MAKPQAPESTTALPPLSLEKAQKGSHRSMWELLLQLRVLLPYLTHLVPLLDRNLLKASPDSVDLTKGLAQIETSTRDLETLSRNQALQMARIEEQIDRLRRSNDENIEENRNFRTDQRTFRRWMMGISIVMVVLLGASVGLLTFLVVRQ